MDDYVKRYHYGCTTVYISIHSELIKFKIVHNGNMGSSLSTVTKNLTKIFGMLFTDYLKSFNVMLDEATGHPDYNYERNVWCHLKECLSCL